MNNTIQNPFKLFKRYHFRKSVWSNWLNNIKYTLFDQIYYYIRWNYTFNGYFEHLMNYYPNDFLWFDRNN